MNQKIIVVATAGHVLLGTPEYTDKGIVLTDAAVIRIWGTTRGLGEIALSGPTPKTILDLAGTVTVPTHAVIMTIACTY